MTILRGPHTTAECERTDSKALSELPDDWDPADIIWLDGTKNKKGTRHTAIGVQLAAEDIASLSAALFRHHNERINELKKIIQDFSAKRSDLQGIIQTLEESLTQISNLIRKYSDDGSSTEILLRNLEKIANHYRHDQSKDDSLELEGIKAL